MEKEQRFFVVPFRVDWSCVTIPQIRKDLEELETKGVTHISLASDLDGEDIDVRITFKQLRIETDEEFSLRLRTHEFLEHQKRKRELSELARLKAKYETNHLLEVSQKMLKAFNDAPKNWLMTTDVADAANEMIEAVHEQLFPPEKEKTNP